MASDLSPDQTLIDQAVSHTLDVMRFEAALGYQAVGYLEELEQEITARLYQADLAAGASAGARSLTFAQEHRLRALLAQIREAIAGSYGAISGDTTSSLADLAELETQWAAETLSISVDLQALSLTASELRAIASDTLIEGAPSAEWWSRQAGDLVQSFSDQVRMGLLQAETNDQLVRRIRGTYIGTGSDGLPDYSGGIMDVTTRNAEALVRTSARAVAAAAARETYSTNRDVVQGLVQISTLDGRTTPTCIAYAGKAWIWKGDQLVPYGHDLPYLNGVPRHWNAIAAGVPVLTDRGSVPIEEVRVGDLVVTHRGRPRRVYATMAKPRGPLPLVGIETESGRVLWASDEHPVLTVGRGWQRADQVCAGDELLEHPEQAMQAGLSLVPIPVTNDCPSLFDEQSFFGDISLDAAEVAWAVDLKRDHWPKEGEVDYPSADGILEHEVDASATQRLEHGGFVGTRRPPVVVGHACATPGERFLGAGGVAIAEHPAPVDLGEARASVVNVEALFGHWHASKVKRILRSTVICKSVHNLAVEEDETYLAAGLVTHNCRSVETPLVDLGSIRPGQNTDLSMDEWLSRRTVAQQDEQLGAGKAALWRAGKISLGDLVNQRGNPASLAQLQRHAA